MDFTDGLSAQLVAKRGDFILHAELQVAAGETLALLGPNGSGKSTLLAAIAGLLALDRGTVTMNGRILTQARTSTPRTHAVPAHRRRIGLLGQDPLLFPHLSALENVAFGPRSRGVDVAQARARASEWIDSVGLTGFAHRKPAELSGGQQQRIAIARVLATEPEVLLFDEPIAALDVQTASLVRSLLRERLTDRIDREGTPPATIVVTHDVVDAMVLADRVAILDDGRIIDSGPVGRVLSQPVNRFAADLVGLNLVTGVVVGDGIVQLPDGRMLRGHGVSESTDSLASGEPVTAVFPPDAVTLSVNANPTDTPLSWRATVGALEPAVRGIRVPLLDDSLYAELTPAQLLDSGIHEGAHVSVSVDPSRVTVYRAHEFDVIL